MSPASSPSTSTATWSAPATSGRRRARCSRTCAPSWEAAGGALRDVIRTTVYLTDIAHHGAMNEVYALFFVSEFPARTTVQVAGLAPALTGDGHPFLVEIDAVAILPPHMETTSWQP
jgi:hypothetical protein